MAGHFLPDNDYWPNEIVTNLGSPPPGIVVFWGYIGKASNRNGNKYRRLYRSVLLNEYIEFKDADVVNSIELGNADNPLGGTVVWLPQGAQIDHVKTESGQAQSSFLGGSIVSGGPGQQQTGPISAPTQANGSFWCRPGPGGGGGGGGSWACGGGSWDCGGGSWDCGHGSWACGGGSWDCGGGSWSCR